MQILFIGTGSADFEMSLQCPCRNCLEARTLGGRNVRTFASILLDGSLLIDCGATVPWRLAELDAPPSAVARLLITHRHEDHLDAEALAALNTARGDAPPLPIYGNGAVMRWLGENEVTAEPHELRPGDAVQVGDFSVLALPAKHDWANQQALNYLITRDGISLLYATDTAWPDDEWWSLLSGHKLAAAIIEATFGPIGPDGHPDCLAHHLNWEKLVELVNELRRRGILNDSATAYATHLSQHFVPIHDRYVEEVSEPGLTIAYDGLRLIL